MKRKPPTREARNQLAPNVDDLDGLRTDRQVLFVIEYCKDFNAYQAERAPKLTRTEIR